MDVKELKGMARNLKEIAGGSEMDGRGVASGGNHGVVRMIPRTTAGAPNTAYRLEAVR